MKKIIEEGQIVRVEFSAAGFEHTDGDIFRVVNKCKRIERRGSQFLVPFGDECSSIINGVYSGKITDFEIVEEIDDSSNEGLVIYIDDFVSPAFKLYNDDRLLYDWCGGYDEDEQDEWLEDEGCLLTNCEW